MSYAELLDEGSRRVEQMLRDYHRAHVDAPRPPDYQSSESESESDEDIVDA